MNISTLSFLLRLVDTQQRTLQTAAETLVPSGSEILHSHRAARTVQPKVDEIKSDMDILKEQLYAKHQDIEALRFWILL